MSGAVRDPLIHAVASLRAAISLLRAGGKKAAVSDCMFAQMLVDYERAADCAAEALTTPSQGLDAATVERCVQFVRNFAARDPAMAKGIDRQRITEAREIVAQMEGAA